MNIAGKTIDQVDIAREKGYDLEKIAGFEDFALKLTFDDGHSVEKFPCGNSTQTRLSTGLFLANLGEFTKQAQAVCASNLKFYSEIQGIGVHKEIEFLAKEAENNTGNEVKIKSSDIDAETPGWLAKDAVDSDDNYGVVVRGYKLYPLHTEELVKEASIMFDRKVGQIPPIYRRPLAKKIKKTAEDQNIQIQGDRLSKYASDTPQMDIDLALRSRRRIYPSKFNEALKTLIDNGDYEKVADALHQFDSHLKIRYEDRPAGIQDPTLTVFTIEKTAGELQEQRILQGIDQGMFSALQEGIVKELKENPIQTYENMPKELKDIVDAQLKNLSI